VGRARGADHVAPAAHHRALWSSHTDRAR
jgi:hypothetical protein